MNQKIQQKVIELSKALINPQNSYNHHISFLVLNNRILHIGCNASWRTHPKSLEIGYFSESPHSELAVFLKLRKKDLITRLTMINVRINTLYDLKISKPCKICTGWLKIIGVRHVWYTTGINKEFAKLW